MKTDLLVSLHVVSFSVCMGPSQASGLRCIGEGIIVDGRVEILPRKSAFE